MGITVKPGFIPAIGTPLDEEGYLVEDSIRAETERMIEAGCSAILCMGSMGQQVFIRDIATVKDTIKDLTLDEKTNGRESVRLIIAKQTGANTVQVCRDVRKELAQIQKQLPTDVKIEKIYDSSENIQNSINSLEESVLYALLFGAVLLRQVACDTDYRYNHTYCADCGVHLPWCGRLELEHHIALFVDHRYRYGGG